MTPRAQLPILETFALMGLKQSFVTFYAKSQHEK